MKIVPEIAALVPEMKAWRHHIHAHPETAFEETATSAFVADKLRSFGLEVHAGLAEDRRRRRAAERPRRRGGTVRDRPARRSRRAAHPGEIRRHARLQDAGQDARMRPRRPYGDAARRRRRARAPQELRRHRVFHLPAGRGERGRRPRDGRGGAVRAFPDARRLRDAQLAAEAVRARSRCAQDR